LQWRTIINTRILYQPEITTPPGETIADLLEERDMTQVALAQRMGRPVNKINEIINGKRTITPETASQFEKVLGIPSTYLLNHEAQYQAYKKRLEEEKEFPRWDDWLNRMPLKALKDVNILPRIHNRGRQNKNRLIRGLLNFFSVSSPKEWYEIYDSMNFAYRQSKSDKSDVYARATWLRMGELKAEEIQCKPFDPHLFKEALQEIRELTTMTPKKFVPILSKLCANSGVVLVFVPAIPKAYVSGAARWINGKPIIQLSLYGKRNDRFWFTFFHEAGHILKHSRQLIFLDDNRYRDVTNEEEEADSFASQMLIPTEFTSELRMLRSEKKIHSFAKRLNVHPGIVIGRLQHEKYILYGEMDNLKDKFDWQSADFEATM